MEESIRADQEVEREIWLVNLFIAHKSFELSIEKLNVSSAAAVAASLVFRFLRRCGYSSSSLWKVDMSGIVDGS